MINRTLRSLFLYNGVFVLAGSLLGPLYAVYVQKINNAPQIISFTWSIFLISSTIFMYFVSRFGDNIRDKKLLVIGGYLVRSMVWILYIFVDNVTTLVLLQILLGFGEALGAPAYNAVVAEYLDRKHHIEDYSDQILFFNITAGIGTLVGGLFLPIIGFNYLFIGMAILALVSALGTSATIKKL